MQVPPAERARSLYRLIRIFPKRRQTNDAQAAHRRRRRRDPTRPSRSIFARRPCSSRRAPPPRPWPSAEMDAASASVQHASRGPSQAIQASPPTFRRRRSASFTNRESTQPCEPLAVPKQSSSGKAPGATEATTVFVASAFAAAWIHRDLPQPAGPTSATPMPTCVAASNRAAHCDCKNEGRPPHAHKGPFDEGVCLGSSVAVVVVAVVGRAHDTIYNGPVAVSSSVDPRNALAVIVYEPLGKCRRAPLRPFPVTAPPPARPSTRSACPTAPADGAAAGGRPPVFLPIRHPDRAARLLRYLSPLVSFGSVEAPRDQATTNNSRNVR